MPATKLSDLILVKGKTSTGVATSRKMRRDDRILQLVRQGVTFRAAAATAGVGKATFYDWCTKGKKATRGPYKKFWDALQQAKLLAQATLEVQFTKHAEKDWRACQARLKFLDPETYGDKPRQVELSGPNGAAVQFDVAVQAATLDLTALAPDQLAALAHGEVPDQGESLALLPPIPHTVDAD